MRIPGIPINEKARLNALRSLKIIDTEDEERFDRVTRLIKRVFNVPIALVSFVEEHRQWYKSIQGVDARESPREESFCSNAIITPEPLVVPDATQDKRFEFNPMVIDDPHIRFYAGWPLELEDGLRMGTLCIIDSKPRDFTQEDLIVFEDFALMIESELRTMNLATTDLLTGLSNRRGFIELAHYAFQVAKRLQFNMTIFYIDMDDFKSINDAFGHQEGDLALQATTELLLHTFRDMDVIGRMGGDEFCVLCCDLDENALFDIQERLKQNFEKYNKSSGKDYELKFSVGALSFDAQKYPSFEAILWRADQAMYEHKRSKKD